MMTNIENLHEGDWVAIDSVREDDHEFAGMFSNQLRRTSFDGTPLRIMAISPPWIAVAHDGKRFAIDLRKYGVRKLDDRYVAAMIGVGEPVGIPGSHVPRKCPSCKIDMSYVKFEKRDGWWWLCNKCQRSEEANRNPCF